MARQASHITGILALVAALASPFAAAAQAQPSASEESGFKLGQGRLHTFFDLENRYDSNVLNIPGGSAGDVILHFRPGVTFKAPGQMTSVDFLGELDWNQYLGIAAAGTRDFSHLFGDANLDVGVNRGGTVGFELTDGFRRSDRTASLSLQSAVISNYNSLQAEVPFRPGGGALQMRLTGRWVLESFDPFVDPAICGTGCAVDPVTLGKYGYNELGAAGEIRWKFLPHTATVLDAAFFSRLPNDRALSNPVSAIKTTTGIAGLVTTHFATTLKAGYADNLSSAGTYRTWLANAEIEYVGPATSGARVGYLHDIGADPGIGYSLYDVHRAYLEGKLTLANRVILRALGEYDFRGYHDPANTSAPTVQFVRLIPSADVQLFRYTSLSVGYAFTLRTSDAPGGTGILAYNYSKNEVWLRLGVAY